jgi:deoxyribonuclease-1-like protein
MTDTKGVSTALVPTAPRPRANGVAAFLKACVLAVAVATPALAQPQPVAGPVPKPWDAILVASFNIQVFGESKMSKPQVVEVLARVVRNFDIVAIQEVRAKSDEILPAFVRAVNADGSRYQHVIGPREGRTSSKEQYAFVYDTNRIEIDVASPGVVPDPQGRLHRPPMHARFRTRITPAEMAFTFWLVDIHTDPDEVPQELDALAGVFQAMQAARPDEDDVIMLGDLNAGPPEFSAFRRIPGIGWAVSGSTTNTRRTKTYDNLVFAQPATGEYLGRWGVLDLQSTFGLPLDNALEVSDHNPVWAAFYPAEARQPMTPSMAGQPAVKR